MGCDVYNGSYNSRPHSRLLVPVSRIVVEMKIIALLLRLFEKRENGQTPYRCTLYAQESHQDFDD